MAWQELSLKERRPGSRGEPAECPLSRSARRLILTFPRAAIPKPSPNPSDSVLRSSNPEQLGLNSLQPHPSPSSGRCASAAAVGTPPLLGGRAPSEEDSAHARTLHSPSRPVPISQAQALSRSPLCTCAFGAGSIRHRPFSTRPLLVIHKAHAQRSRIQSSTLSQHSSFQVRSTIRSRPLPKTKPPSQISAVV